MPCQFKRKMMSLINQRQMVSCMLVVMMGIPRHFWLSPKLSSLSKRIYLVRSCSSINTPKSSFRAEPNQRSKLEHLTGLKLYSELIYGQQHRLASSKHPKMRSWPVRIILKLQSKEKADMAPIHTKRKMRLYSDHNLYSNCSKS